MSDKPRVPIDWNTRATVSSSAIKLIMAHAIGMNQSIMEFRKVNKETLTPDEIQGQEEFETAVRILKGQLGIIINNFGKEIERRW